MKWFGHKRRRREEIIQSMLEKPYRRHDELAALVAGSVKRIDELCGARDWASQQIKQVSRDQHERRRDAELHRSEGREFRTRLELLEERISTMTVVENFRLALEAIIEEAHRDTCPWYLDEPCDCFVGLACRGLGIEVKPL